MALLSINLNKFALIRNARGTNKPDLIDICKRCIIYGAGGITVHPRPDERHVKFTDLMPLLETIKKMDKLQQHINTNTATFIQKGVCESFKIGDDFWSVHNADFKRKVLHIENTVKANLNIGFIPPDGGLFVFVSIIHHVSFLYVYGV